MENSLMYFGNIIGSILQSIFITYFIITTKNIKNKRLIFIILTTIDYLLLKILCELNYTVNFEIILGVSICLILKVLYGSKARITDFIIYIISLVFLGISSVFIALTIGMNIYGLVIANIIPIFATFLLKHKLTEIDCFFSKFWNRHNNKKMLKSITIRGLSTILTIMTFVLLHTWLIYGILIVRR